LDKSGKTIFFSNNNEINSSENRFFIFNKVFNKDLLLKIFEENVDKLISNVKVTYPSSSSSFTETLRIWTNDQYARGFERLGLSFPEMKVIEEFLFGFGFWGVGFRHKHHASIFNPQFLL